MIGARLFQNNKMPDKAVIDMAKEMPVSKVLDVTNGLFGFSNRIKRVSGTGKLTGRAVTVKSPDGDNLAIHNAVSLINSSDVLVIGTNNPYSTQGLMGGGNGQLS